VNDRPHVAQRLKVLAPALRVAVGGHEERTPPPLPRPQHGQWSSSDAPSTTVVIIYINCINIIMKNTRSTTKRFILYHYRLRRWCSLRVTKYVLLVVSSKATTNVEFETYVASTIRRRGRHHDFSEMNAQHS